MAIDFVHYHHTDLALHAWTDNFNLEEYLRATRAYMMAPAAFEILDIRRLNLASIRSVDLFKLAEHLRSIYGSDRHVPGKTAIVYQEEVPLIYSSSQRLFHSFSIWVKEHQLPRNFALFPDLEKAIAWLGSPQIQALADNLASELHVNQALSA